MENIVLLCAQGMSTGMLVNKMKQEVKKKGFNYNIEAHAVEDVETVAKYADCILLGPQVHFELEYVNSKTSGIPVSVIDSKLYGRLEGAKVLDDAIKLINNNQEKGE